MSDSTKNNSDGKPVPGTPEGVPGLSVEGISKGFPGVQALEDVSFSIRSGEVHVLLGENGAGKSTLLKILSGALQPDSGRILLDGKEIVLKDPGTASAAGVAAIYQELSLVSWLSVAHNLFLGREQVAGRFLLSRSVLNRKAGEVLTRLGVSLDPNERVGTLGMAEQQLVEIARAFSRSARFILMDEPTASLTETEIDLLFRKIETLKKSGVGILYISHRLEELSRIADRITVMRDGRTVYGGPAGELSMADLISRMVGRPIGKHYPKEQTTPGELLLETEPETAEPTVPFFLRAGEIAGIAGLVGAGRTEWARSVFGADPDPGLNVRVFGKETFIGSPSQGRDLGIGMVPENRKEHGLIAGRSVRQNITITILDWLSRRAGIINRRKQASVSGGYVRKLGIKCPSDSSDIASLSGGNQQKAVLAKWLAKEGRIMILDEPTRGIDVGAKLEMYHHMNDMCREGKGIILISSDLPELLSMSDRIYVMYRGKFVTCLSREEASQERVLEYASGLHDKGNTRQGNASI